MPEVIRRRAGSIALALFTVLTTLSVTKADTLAFENVRLLVGDGRPAIENATLVIDGERIVQAGRSEDIRVPASAKRVNVAGKTVMPALIDTHVHVNQPREALIADLRRLAYFGVGTVLSLGVDTGDAPFEVRAQPIDGAARLLTAGRGITAPEPGRETAPYWVTTAEQARQAVQDNAARKVDIIKVWVDDRGGRVQKLSAPLYSAVIDAAHEKRLLVTAHIFALDDAKSLLRAGVDSFAHSVRDREVDAELLALVRDRPAFVLNPNLTNRGEPTDLSWLRAALSAADFAKAEERNQARPEDQRAFLIQARNLMLMKQAGARVVLGTDSSFDFPNGNTPWAAHIEMEDMVAAGMTPAEVIAAATADAAAFIRQANVGTLEPGKVADVLVLDADPLAAIGNTRRIHSVYLRGRPVDRAAYP